MLQNIVEVDRSKAHSESKMRVAQARVRHADVSGRSQAFLGAAPTVLPAFFICASKDLRAFFHVFSVNGTSQLPCPLQEFWPAYSPQPPWPLQALSPLQE